MAQKLGFMSQMLGGEWADRHAINRNADDLATVEQDVGSLQATVMRQAGEILKLRAMFMGVVELIHAKLPFDDAELERAVQAAYATLTAPPPASQRGARPVAPSPQVTCIKCARVVPASATNITANGNVCDNCM